jgi:uncharacterized protein (DUF885 family)
MKRFLLVLCVIMLVMGSVAVVSARGVDNIDMIVDYLEGLAIDGFFEESYNQLLLRDPELLTDLGLSATFGVGNDQLTDISDEYVRQTQALQVAILDLLHGYDYEKLTAEQQLSYDIYQYYLDDIVRGHQFMYYDYPVSPMFILNVPDVMVYLFTEIQPVTNQQDAEDYIARLSQMDTKFEQLVEGLELRAGAGVIVPRFFFPYLVGNLQNMARGQARYTPFYTTLRDKLADLDNIDDDTKDALLDSAETEIEETVLPVYQLVVEAMNDLESRATYDAGAWKFPEGDAYYAYVLRHFTTTEMTPDEIYELGLQEVARIRAEMQVIFAELGYPAGETLVESFDRVTQDSGVLRGDEILAGFEAIIDDAEERVAASFDMLPSTEVVVIPDQYGGYYSPPALDGSRPGAFYAATSGTRPWFNMPSLAYHEAVPGHHFQIAIAQELDLPSFRRGSHFTAYVEGWALYAERLAWELGFYEGDPYGNLGRLQYEAFRAVRLVVDTGTHAKGWTYDQAAAYMQENTGFDANMVNNQISRYIAWPGQSTAYMVGMLQILDLRQQAMDELGDAFDLREFHNVVLGNGAVPLAILEQLVQQYIDTTLAG